MLLNVDWEERVNWERLRKYRIDRIVEQLKKKGLRAVMLSKLDTIRYATSSGASIPGNSTETAISP